ncbi:pentapeptide repeat-containing protein [Cellulomonas fengjieae]|uniref:pentapeptide repeat-containing protein n=1 Tax=Cellulomonas fengjieae TaxID=2819978 RepID=UPI003898D5E5
MAADREPGDLEGVALDLDRRRRLRTRGQVHDVAEGELARVHVDREASGGRRGRRGRGLRPGDDRVDGLGDDDREGPRAGALVGAAGTGSATDRDELGGERATLPGRHGQDVRVPVVVGVGAVPGPLLEVDAHDLAAARGDVRVEVDRSGLTGDGLDGGVRDGRRDDDHIRGRLLVGTVLVGTVLSRAVLTGTVLGRTVLTGTVLSRTVLTGTVLSRTVLTGTVLSRTVLSRTVLARTVLGRNVLTRAILGGGSRGVATAGTALVGECPDTGVRAVEGRRGGDADAPGGQDGGDNARGDDAPGTGGRHACRHVSAPLCSDRPGAGGL